MIDINARIKQAEREGDDFTTGTPASAKSIERLEVLLSKKFPESYKKFLSEYGYIGVEVQGRFIEGIFDDNPEGEGGIYHSTLEMRKWMSEHYETQPYLWAIQLHEDGAYCINTEIVMPNNEFAIVNYEPYLPKETFREVLAGSFEEFLDKWFF